MTRSVFLTSVKRTALGYMIGGWHRHHVTMNLDTLLLVEKYNVRQGRPQALA